MSRIFGPIYQNGYVVDDMDAAIEHWTTQMGVGPFIRMPVQFSKFVYRGVESSPLLDVALANSGDLQIELIAQVNDEPSVYREFLEKHGPGMQHVSAWTDDFDRDVARLEAEGREVVMEVAIDGILRAVFYDTDIPLQMELIERNETVRSLIEHVRQIAIGWDGNEPVRAR